MHIAALIAVAALLGSTQPTWFGPGSPHPDTACPSRKVPLEGRKSPLDSLTFKVANQPVKVCYGRPASRGRVMLGGEERVHRSGQGAGAGPGQGEERIGQLARRAVHHSGGAQREGCRPVAGMGEDPSDNSVQIREVTLSP
jgi:hypothetical protein